jgi:hypothetical protein
VDEPVEEEHEQQLLQAAAPVNFINSPATHRLTQEPYHDTRELHHHDAHDINTPVAPAAATCKKNSSSPRDLHLMSNMHMMKCGDR